MWTFDSDAEDDEDDHETRRRRRINRRKKSTGDSADYSSDSESDETLSDVDPSELEDDAFTATGEGESVYSEKPAYVPSKQATLFSQTKNKGGHGKYEEARRGVNTNDESAAALPKFKTLYKRVRIKLLAFSRFLQLRRRGLLLRSLSVARCGLGPFTAQVAAYAFRDNSYLHNLDLSHNAIGHSEIEQANTKTLQELASSTGLHTLRLRQCGLFEEGLGALVKGANQAESSLRELDLSGNHCGPTGAAIVASASHLYVDQGSFSLGFRPKQEDVFGFSERGSSAFHGKAYNQALTVVGEKKATVKWE